MKRMITIFAAVCAFSTCAFAGMPEQNTSVIDEFAEKIIENRAYIRPGNVFVSANMIYIKTDESFIPVDSISADEDGVYVDLHRICSTYYCNRCKRHWDPAKQYNGCPHYDRKLGPHKSCEHGQPLESDRIAE